MVGLHASNSIRLRSIPGDIRLYYGKINSLAWNPGKFEWPGSIPFINFTTKLGRGLLKRRKIIQDVTERKWSGILPTRFKFVGRMFGIAATLVKKLGCCG
jgi:hypothetical protein